MRMMSRWLRRGISVGIIDKLAMMAGAPSGSRPRSCLCSCSRSQGVNRVPVIFLMASDVGGAWEGRGGFAFLFLC